MSRKRSLQKTTRFCALVIITPWLSVLSAEPMNALRRNCALLAPRNAVSIQIPIASQEGNDGDAAEQELPHQIGIEFADIARRGEACGRRGRPRKSARRSNGEQTDEGLRRNRILPFCLPFPVSHYPPEVCRRSVWLDGFGSGKCLPPAILKCDPNYGNWPDMINASLTGLRCRRISRQTNGLFDVFRRTERRLPGVASADFHARFAGPKLTWTRSIASSSERG